MGSQIGWKASFSWVCFYCHHVNALRLMCLSGLYLILAVTFWYYPGSGMLAKDICHICSNANDSLPFSSCLGVYLTYYIYYYTIIFIILEFKFKYIPFILG